MRALVIFSCLLFCHQVASWPWSRQEEEEPTVTIPTGIIHAQGDGSEVQQCLRAGREGRCEFYDCLDRRFDCTSNGYTNQISKHFCRKIDRAYNQFNTFGKKWLNRTSVCLMQPMLSIYSGESTTCSEIRNAGIQAIITCNNQTVDNQNFCDFIRGNVRQYAGLMGQTEMAKLQSLNSNEIWRSMITQGLECGGAVLSDAWSSFLGFIADLGQSLAQGIASLIPWN